MKTVEPIRNIKKLEEFKTALKNKNEKYFIMALIGLNLGLRIGDILKIKVSKIYNQDYLELIEEKTGKLRRNKLSYYIKQTINSYVERAGLKPDDYLIYSNKRNKDGSPKAISRTQAYLVIKEAANKVEIDNVGTHTLRKSFGYHHYQQNRDVALLQEILNHSAPSITLRYIGINQDLIDDSLSKFQL